MKPKLKEHLFAKLVNDLTLSAPKSVSVLIALYGESRLLEAHNQAVEVVSREIESLTGTRIMRDGLSQHVHTGKMVAAAEQIHQHAEVQIFLW